MGNGVIPRTPERQKIYSVHRSQTTRDIGNTAHKDNEQGTTGHDGL
jgi:hypothetical protein